MTSRPHTAAHTADIFPPGRYGRRRQPRRHQRWLLAVLLAAVLAAGGFISVRLYQMYGDPTYDAKVITYTDITDDQIVIEFQVTVPPGESAVCALRARSYDGATVGRAEVHVTARAGERLASARHRLATSARPIIGEVLNCRPAA